MKQQIVVNVDDKLKDMLIEDVKIKRTNQTITSFGDKFLVRLAEAFANGCSGIYFEFKNGAFLVKTQKPYDN